jgi:hypothetical protein
MELYTLLPALLSPRVELLEWNHSIVIVGQRKEHGRACHPATQKFQVKGWPTRHLMGR